MPLLEQEMGRWSQNAPHVRKALMFMGWEEWKDQAS